MNINVSYYCRIVLHVEDNKTIQVWQWNVQRFAIAVSLDSILTKCSISDGSWKLSKWIGMVVLYLESTPLLSSGRQLHQCTLEIFNSETYAEVNKEGWKSV